MAGTESISGRVVAMIQGTRLAIPRLRERGGGQIVNVISGAAWVAPPALATYAASKHAVKGFSDAVREELHGDRIELTAVYPNLVRTELAVGTKPARGGRWIEPDEVGEAVAAAIERPRAEVFIPRWIAGVLRSQAALPPRARDAIGRACGLAKLSPGGDPGPGASSERPPPGG